MSLRNFGNLTQYREGQQEEAWEKHGNWQGFPAKTLDPWQIQVPEPDLLEPGVDGKQPSLSSLCCNIEAVGLFGLLTRIRHKRLSRQCVLIDSKHI